MCDSALTGDAKVNDEQPLPPSQPAASLESRDDRALHDTGEERADLGGGGEDGGPLAELPVLVP
jgi:hypothetical protein